MITVDDGQRLDALEIAFLQTVAVVLHDVENDAVRGGVFRRQADAAEPEPDITDYECIDLVGGPSIDGFEVPIDWCRPVTAWVVCTRFDEAGYPAKLFYSVGGPGIGNPVRIDRQPTGEYIVTEG